MSFSGPLMRKTTKRARGVSYMARPPRLIHGALKGLIHGATKLRDQRNRPFLPLPPHTRGTLIASISLFCTLIRNLQNSIRV